MIFSFVDINYGGLFRLP